MEKVYSLLKKVNANRSEKERVSSGYIGNVYFSKGKQVDDTSWKIFVPPTERQVVTRTYKSRIEGQEGQERSYTTSVGSAPYGDSIGGFHRADAEEHFIYILEKLLDGDTLRTNSGADFRI
jgi:hypothetical protein